ncbi:hypothetical protein B7486_12665 [cyanobacterium TDX16]|nr:hypothetical protein B7486_12665 [cyanobacterium TDX16]
MEGEDSKPVPESTAFRMSCISPQFSDIVCNSSRGPTLRETLSRRCVVTCREGGEVAGAWLARSPGDRWQHGIRLCSIFPANKTTIDGGIATSRWRSMKPLGVDREISHEAVRRQTDISIVESDGDGHGYTNTRPAFPVREAA